MSALKPHLLFPALIALLLIPFWATLAGLLKLSLADDRYSHIALIPLISAGIVWLERRRIFPTARYSPKPGGALLLAGLLLHSAAARWMAPAGVLSAQVLAVLLAWAGAFLLCYGPRPLKSAAFPALFLLLAIPVPAAAVEKVSFALQAASAELSHALFRLLGVPVFRQGHVFALPGLTIEVAEECSGIRSTTALIISSILAGYVFLRSGWRRLSLVLVTAFVAVFKNALRIVFLATMSVYVDPGFLHGMLHHRYGGTVFSLVALAMIAPVFLVLRRSDPPAPAPVHPAGEF